MTFNLRQVQWRSRRGARELDLLLQAYLENCFEQADESERCMFLKLLALSDEELSRYLLRAEAPENVTTRQIVAKIRSQSAY